MGKGERGEAAQAPLKGAAPAAPPRAPAPRSAAWAQPRGVRGAAPDPAKGRPPAAAECAGGGRREEKGPPGREFISLVISSKLLYSGNAVPLIEQAR